MIVFAVSAVVKSAAVARKSLMVAIVCGQEEDGLEVVVRKKTSDVSEMPKTLEVLIY